MAAAVSTAALPTSSLPLVAPPLPSSSSPTPPSRSFTRILRSSFQETLRHVNPTSRKGKEKEDEATHFHRTRNPGPPIPPSAFLNRPPAVRKSLDRPNDARLSNEKPRDPPPRRSFDALTQKSASTSFTQASQSSSDREKDRDKLEGDNRDRPRVLRKQPSSTAKRRPGADSPEPYRQGRFSPSPDPSRSSGIRRLLSPISPSHSSSSQSHSRTTSHPHARSLAPSPVPRASSPGRSSHLPAHPNPGTATSQDRESGTAASPKRDGGAASPDTYPERDVDSDTDRDPDPIWSPFLPPTLSKGTMSSPTLVALRDAAEHDYDYNHERSGGYDAKHARERVGRQASKDSRCEGLKDTATKQPQVRRQRSPLVSLGAFLSTSKKLSFSGGVASVAPSISARSSKPQSGSGSHIPTPTLRTGSPSLDSTRVAATPSASTLTPGPCVPSPTRPTFESTRTPAPATNPNATTSHTNSAPSPTPASVEPSVNTKTKTKAGRSVPSPLVISRPRGLGSASQGPRHTSPPRAARASPTRTPTPTSTPKTSRLIGIGHPSTPHRRSGASASTSHLPLPGTSTPTRALASASTTTLSSSSAPAAGLAAARSSSPPASPTRTRSPTASTSASRARERERATPPVSRATSPTIGTARARSPVNAKRATSPTSGRASSPATALSSPTTASATSPTASPARPVRRASGIVSGTGNAKASALGMRIGMGSISASHLPLSSTGSTSQSPVGKHELGSRDGVSTPPLAPGRAPMPGSPRRTHGHSSSVPIAIVGSGSSGSALGTARTSTRTGSPLLGSVAGASGGLGETASRSASATTLVGGGTSSPEESGGAISSSPSSLLGGRGEGGVSKGWGINAVSISPGREIIRRAVEVLIKEMRNQRTSAGTAAGSAEIGSPEALGTASTSLNIADSAGSAAYPGTLTKSPPILSKDAWDAVDARMRGLVRLERMLKSGGEGGDAGGVADDKTRRIFGDALKDGYVLCQFLNILSPAIIPRPDPSATSSARVTNIANFIAAAVTFGVPPAEVFERHDFEGGLAGLAKVAGCVVAIERVAGRKGMGDKAGGESITGKVGAKADKGTNAAHGAEVKPNPAIPPSPSPTRRVMSKSPSSTAVMGLSTSVYAALPAGSASSPNLLASPSGNKANEVATSQTGPSVQGVMKQKQMLQIQKQKHQKRWSPPGLLTLKPASSVERTSGECEREIGLENGDDIFGPMEFVDGAGPPSPQRSGARSSIASSSQATDITNAYSSLFDPRSSMHTRFGTIRTVTTEATSLGTDVPSLTRTEASAFAADLNATNAGSIPYRSRSASALIPNGSASEESPRRRDRKVSDGLGIVDLSRVAEETDEGSVRHRTPPPAPPPRLPLRDKSPPIRLGKGKWPDDFMNAFQYSARGSPSPHILEGDSEAERTGLENPLPLSGSPPRQRVRRPSNSLDLKVATSSDAVEPILPTGRLRRRSSKNSVDVLLPKDMSLAIGRDSSPASSRDSSTPSPGPSTPGGPRQPIRRRPSNRNYAPRTTSPGHDRLNLDASAPVPVPFPRSISGEHSPLATLPSSSETLHGELASGAFESPVDAAVRQPYQRGRHRSDMDKRSSLDDHPAQRLAGKSRFESMVNLGGANDFSKGETSLVGGMDGSAVRKCLVVKEEGKPLTRYQLGNCIGRGQFGSVYRALNLNTGQMVAVKRIRLEGLSETEIAQLTHEVEIVKGLSHPGIVKYEGMAKDSDTLSIVLEYVENGSLAQTLKTFGKLDESLVATYVTKVLEGLDYLHRSQVVHCDLKAANILTTKTGNVKLSDFGVSLNLRVRAMEEIKNDIAGTPNWMAPEVIELKGASPASDIWSLACTIIELLTGRPPYADVENGMSVMFRIVEDPMPPIPKGFSEPLQDFLKHCFNKDPAQRPNAEMLCEHPWLKNEWGLHKELRPQDSIPFLRRVSADLQRSDVRYLTFLEEDSASSPRSSNGFTPTTEPPHPHTFVKSTFAQAVTCRVCNQPVKKSAVFCTECSLISHSKCASDAPETCDLRAQVIRLSQDLQREVVRQQSPLPSPVNIVSSSPPPQVVESPLSSSPTDRFRMFGRKKSKNNGLVVDAVEPSKSTTPPVTTPPVAFRYDDPQTKRTIFPRRSNITDDHSRSRGSIASSHQSSSMRSAATGGSLSGGGAGARPVSVTESELQRASRYTDSSLAADVQVLVNTSVRGETFLKRKGSRREKKESESDSSRGCIIV